MCFYAKERIAAQLLAPGTYIGVNELLQDYQGRSTEIHQPAEDRCIAYKAGDILLGNIRPYLKKMWLADSDGGTNGDVLVIRSKDANVVTPKFLRQMLSSSRFTDYNIQHSKGAKMPRGDKQAIMQFEIPVPPLEEQERIVGILDKFDALVNDISAGIPAEIEARRKQYAYYRDKLLAFPEKAA